VRRRRWWDAGIPFWLVYLQSLSLVVEEFWSRSGKEDIVLMNTSIIHDINKVQPTNSTACKQQCHTSIRMVLALPIHPHCFTEALEFWVHSKLGWILSHKHTHENVYLYSYLFIYLSYSFFYFISALRSKGSHVVPINQIMKLKMIPWNFSMYRQLKSYHQQIQGNYLTL